MINLRSLMDLLPYYFRDKDTYKVNGKGLLERYIDIFGEYFDNKIVNNIKTLDDILDFDSTPELYLGYLWEFLGSMPYANPKAIDPEKWKQYFNGFSDDSNIESLSRIWVYNKDIDNDHYNLDVDQVRAIVKYSVALFSIRGTKRFFEVLLKLYGFDVVITNGPTYPGIITEDDDDSDYYGSDDNYGGLNDNYGGLDDSIFDSNIEQTKLDSEWLLLDDNNTLDKHSNCNRLVNVYFRLTGNYVYTIGSNEFFRLNDRMFNLINLFLPINTRPHLIWDHVNTGNGFTPKVKRYIEVYVDRPYVGWSSDDSNFIISEEYPGWYQVLNTSSIYSPARNFSWEPLKIMVRVKDNYSEDLSLTGKAPAFINDQVKRFKVAFNGSDYSESSYEDGHIFTIKPGSNGLYPKFKVDVLCEDDFDLSDGLLSTFIISNWLKTYNYTLFKQYNSSVNRVLSDTNQYVPILIQSALVHTFTNDADPSDDNFVSQQVINLTTGEYITECDSSTVLEDNQGNLIDYSQYSGMNIYVQHIYKPGVYEFIMLDKPEFKLTIEVELVDEVLTLSLIQGDVNNILDDNNPSCDIQIRVTSNIYFLEDHVLSIKETSNPITGYWDNEEVITLTGPGHYRFYGVSNYSSNPVSNYIDINVVSLRYEAKYYLEVMDDDKSDDEAYMVRTLIPRLVGNSVNWGFDFRITLNKSVLEAMEILAINNEAFDFEVKLYYGSNPSVGTFINSFTATQEITVDDNGEVLPNYIRAGRISLKWDGTYDNIHYEILNNNEVSCNCPPGIYCIELNNPNQLMWVDSPSYRLVDAYIIPQQFDGNLYFDVDIISKAWTSPAGQVYDIDPITGKYTWGWFKSNSEYQHSVHLVRYDPSIGIPQFRLKLTNNNIGYTRVYMYKLVENGMEWDNNSSYPKVLPPKIPSSMISRLPVENRHWLKEAIPKDWGFPGDFTEDTDGWDYGYGPTGISDYTGRWVFTGSVYQIDEMITGPQEPGKYIFLVNQIESIDTSIINYAYLEVKEDIKYSLIVDPLLAILQGSVVGTNVDVISSAVYTKEVLAISITYPNSQEGNEKYPLPYAFYASQAGVYTFKLYKREGGQWVDLQLMAEFKVLTDNGVSPESLTWSWSDLSERSVMVATTSSDVEWLVTVQDE